MSDSKSLSAELNQGLSGAQVAFCDMLADCVSVKDACAAAGWTRSVYRRMCAELPAFDAAVARAREHAQDALVDAMHEIAANDADVNRARLRVDAIKWTASKIKPRVYGDKLDLNINATIDIGSALQEARLRATLRPMCDLPAPIDAEFEALPSVEAPRAVDKESTPKLPDIFS